MTPRLRVLYADHTSLVSGAQHSLLLMLDALAEQIDVTLACPPGSLRDRASAAGVAVVPLHGTSGSLRLHPLHTPRAVAEHARSAVQLRRSASRLGAQVLHANSIRAGLMAVAAGGKRGVVCHVRDVLPDSRVTRGIMGVLGRADAVIAISQYTAERVRQAGCSAPVHVIDNPVDLDRFRPAGDRERTRESLALPDDAPVLCVVGQITPWKGQREAIETLALVRAVRPDAHLLLVGEPKFVSGATRFDNRAYVRELRTRMDRPDVAGHVAWLGERADIPELMRASDVMLMPSWEEPFGRTAAEAMAVGTPLMSTAVGGPAEFIVDRATGRLLPPRDPGVWANAVLEALDHPAETAQLASAARHTALERFAPARHAAALLDVYGALRTRKRGRVAQ